MKISFVASVDHTSVWRCRVFRLAAFMAFRQAMSNGLPLVAVGTT